MTERILQHTKTNISAELPFVAGMGVERFEDWVEEKFEHAKQRTIEKYPELKEEIDRSLEVPQSDEYHAEGKTMEAHLKLIIRTLHNIAKKEFPIELPEDIREMLYNAVVAEDESGKSIVNPELEEYVFMHDISKADCLNLKFEGTTEVAEITWDEWLRIRAQGEPYSYAHPETGKSEPIKNIGYFHPSKGGEGKHGEHGVEHKLKQLGMSDRIKLAIAQHEVAFLFETSAAQKFIDHFVDQGFTDPQDQAFILTASFIDSASSLGKDGKPRLENFLHLAQAKKNYELIKEYEEKGVTIRSNDLQRLKNKNGEVTRKDIEEKIIRNRIYNMPAVKEELKQLVLSGDIEQPDMDFVVDVLENGKDQQEFGRVLRAKFGKVKPILQKHEV